MNLDVGCGSNFKGDVNLDLNIQQIKIPNFVRGDIHHLPFNDEVFEVVFCYSVLEHVGIDYVKAVKELLRVTKYKLEICVPHFLSSYARVPEHARVFRSRHLHRIFRNYCHIVKWVWQFPFIRPKDVVVTIFKSRVRREEKRELNSYNSIDHFSRWCLTVEDLIPNFLPISFCVNP